MKKLIIGCDESERSEDAIELGRVLCDLVGAEPVLVSSISTLHPSVESFGPEAARTYRRMELEDECQRRLGGRRADIRVTVGASAGRDLIAAAEDLNAVCLVIGSSHRGSVGRVALGSVGNSLIHGAPCAVAVALRGYAGSAGALLEVGVAFDGTPESWAALETGIGLAKQTHGRLSVITVFDLTAHATATAFSVLAAGELTSADHEEKRRVLDLALARIPDELPVKGSLLNGAPGPTLASVSADLDLLIVGSKGYGPVRRTFAGSVATHVFHHAGSAVMVLPRGKGIDPLGAKESYREAAHSRSRSASRTARPSAS